MAAPSGSRPRELRSIGWALLAAALYAISTPVSKLLLQDVAPTMMAGLLYLGAGLGMLAVGVIRRRAGRPGREQRLTRRDLPYTIGMVVLDIAAPICLMAGLARTSAANASLLNNFEIVATAFIALLVFREPIGRRLWLAIGLITLSSMLLSLEDASSLDFSFGSVFVLAACVCWGFENNCTRMMSASDPLEIVVIKGFGSGLGSLAIGAAIGAAIIWFLVAPAVHQSQSDRMNSQMREYSEQIDALQAQISAQTRTLDEYRAAGDDAAAATAKAQATSASYESLLTVSDQNRSGEYSDAALADTLLTITRDSLGAEGQALYDELASDIYPNACRTNFRSGTNALDAQNYADAVTYLAKVVQMDSTYNGGEALFRLAQAYLGNGDTENATTYFQRVVSEYGDSEYAADAQTNLDTIAQSAAAGAGTDTGTGDGADTGGAAE